MLWWRRHLHEYLASLAAAAAAALALFVLLWWHMNIHDLWVIWIFTLRAKEIMFSPALICLLITRKWLYFGGTTDDVKLGQG